MCTLMFKWIKKHNEKLFSPKIRDLAICNNMSETRGHYAK